MTPEHRVQICTGFQRRCGRLGGSGRFSFDHRNTPTDLWTASASFILA
jgi:hypothetical protein